MSKFFLIKEETIQGRTQSIHRSLIDGSRDYNSYDEAIQEAQRNLNIPSEVIYVVEMVGKVFGAMQVKTENIKPAGMAIDNNDKKFNGNGTSNGKSKEI